MTVNCHGAHAAFASDLVSVRRDGLDLAANIGPADKRIYCDFTAVLIAHVPT